ncbi:hypothetical protein [Ramlibacter sp.]|uniref:hypothetical protein n=1 Tax=Ramlibacter sp. TaxID=1917967 RepID=UPI003D0D8118
MEKTMERADASAESEDKPAVVEAVNDAVAVVGDKVGDAAQAVGDKVEDIAEADERREGFPGEHWLVLALGIALWQDTRRNRHWAVRTAGSLGASVLVARAASGRKGLAKILKYTPWGSRIQNCPPCEVKASGR